MFKRIISFVLVIAIVFCFAVPSAFAITEYRSKATNIFDMWFTYLYNNADDVWDENSPLPLYGTAIKGITTALNSKICQESHDGYHASLAKFVPDEAFGIDDHGRYALLICEYCGDYFRCYSSDLIAAHDEYVASLDSTSADSTSSLIGFSCTGMRSDSLKILSFLNYKRELLKSVGVNERVLILSAYGTSLYGYYFDAQGRLCYGTFTNPNDTITASCFGIFDLASYEMTSTMFDYVQGGSSYLFYDSSYLKSYSTSSSAHYAIDWDATYNSWYWPDYYSERLYVPVFERTANSSILVGDSYNVYIGSYSKKYSPDPSTCTYTFGNVVTQPSGTDATSRSGSLMKTINNYNVDNSVVDNSSNVNYYIAPKSYVTELTDNSIDIEQCTSPAMYDEETLVFTVPGSDYQILTTGWTYDYTTRTYDISVAPGTTTSDFEIDVTRIVITYGDDTVYFSLYLADGTLLGTEEYAYVMVSGDENFGTVEPEEPDEPEDPGEDPEEDTHKHSYTSTVTTEPTCEAPGIRKYTCSECGDSYTEKISATGHTWSVKQTVATQYDDSGAVTVQGYTIYKCSVCNTEYKDDAGTGPPNNSADSGDGESIFKKIGQLLGSILSGLLGMIEAVLGGLLDGLVRLADLVGDKLTQVVDIVTGLFDKIPQLFGGFTALLADVFVFIPEDIMTIFTFGAAAIVFVGILMFFIKR